MRVDHTWIPMADGTRLAARLWLPDDAHERPVPALLEYLPYRKGDAFAARDSRHHPYFAAHGYAGVRVDLRGTGDSDGILLDEYLPQEQEDALEVIAWLAAQPWCSAAVGMIGISWGGFNGLQVAARRPPALKAVVSMCASDDRYSDDVHYKGGCVLATDMLPWAATMLTSDALPPDPAAVGEGWRDTWTRRLEETPPMIEAWLGHQRRDDYWRHGSVCEDYEAIEAPVWAVGGWADGYTNAVPRLVEGLPGRCHGIIGPWSHAFPMDGAPGPAIGFLQECMRFFDHWLKGAGDDRRSGRFFDHWLRGAGNGNAGPALLAWLQDPVPPATHYTERPGRWVADPVTATATHTLTDRQVTLPPSFLATGAHAGAWCADGGEGDWPPDQREEDALSLTFDLDPLAEPLAILGTPAVVLRLAADRPNALVAVRLCDVSPDGTSYLITRGLLNLTHRDSHAEPAPLAPGTAYDVVVPLDVIGQVVPAGHRLRVALSSAYWPWAWPSPEPATLTVDAAELRLPVLAGEGPAPPPFHAPVSCEPLAVEVLEPGRTTRTHAHDPETGTHEVRFEWDVGGHRRLVEHGTEMHDTNVTTYRIAEGDPLSAEVHVACMSALGRGAWQTRVETDSRMTATAEAFHVTQRLDAFEGDEQVFGRTWEFSFPRDLV